MYLFIFLESRNTFFFKSQPRSNKSKSGDSRMLKANFSKLATLGTWRLINNTPTIELYKTRGFIFIIFLLWGRMFVLLSVSLRTIRVEILQRIFISYIFTPSAAAIYQKHTNMYMYNM